MYVCEDKRTYPVSGLESSKKKEVGKARRSFQTSCLGFTPRAALAAGHAAIVRVTGVHSTAWLSIKLYFDQFVVYCSFLQTLLLDVHQWDIHTCLNIHNITKMKQTKITYGDFFFVNFMSS